MFPQPRWLPPENFDEEDDHDEDYDDHDDHDDVFDDVFVADQGVVDEAVLLLSLNKPIPLQLIVFMMMLMMVTMMVMRA